jgi:hypothetical protein
MAKLDMIIAFLCGRALHFDIMWPCLQCACIVGGVTVRFDLSASINLASDNMANTRLVIARHMHKANTPTLFRRHQNRGFIGVLAANVGFVHLHAALQLVTDFSNHRAANAMRPGPGGLVGTKPQNTLQVSC